MLVHPSGTVREMGQDQTQIQPYHYLRIFREIGQGRIRIPPHNCLQTQKSDKDRLELSPHYCLQIDQQQPRS
jgi:hypothetical protein